MSPFRMYAFAALAALFCLAIQPAAALPTSGPGVSADALLHPVHGRHSACVRGHRHRSDGVPIPCGRVAPDDDDDGPDDEDGDEGPDLGDDAGGGGVCVQVGPVEVCQ